MLINILKANNIFNNYCYKKSRTFSSCLHSDDSNVLVFFARDVIDGKDGISKLDRAVDAKNSLEKSRKKKEELEELPAEA